MDRLVVLSVGDSYHLQFGKDRIVYAGMPSEDVYSIVQRKWEFLYRGFAWNLFYPKERSRITIDEETSLSKVVTMLRRHRSPT